MAKQAGTIFIEGTLDDLTFYKMNGKYYVRMKSSLTGKKFRKHKAFERSRESCKRFGEGNRLASKLYRSIDKEKRVYTLYCFLKKKAIMLFKEGKSLVEAEEILTEYLRAFGLVKESEKEVISEENNSPEYSATLTHSETSKDFEHKTSLLGNIMSLKKIKKAYACAAGPPNVIGI